MIRWIKKLIYIVIAIVILSICVNMFLGPHNIAAGGLTGLGLILEELLGFDRSMVILIGNAIVLIIAFIFLGRETFFNTAIGAILLPVFIGIVPQITLVSDSMLSMIIGSALFGVAVSILYSNQASSGGTAVPPLILKKHFNMNPAIGLFITDGIIVTLCLLVFSLDAFFLAILSIYITSFTMSNIETGLNRKKLVYIISDKHKLITDKVLNTINRGVTIVPSIGAYKQKKRSMLMVTLDKRDYQELLTVVNEYDKKAFMITNIVTDVHGEGFTYDSGSI